VSNSLETFEDKFNQFGEGVFGTDAAVVLSAYMETLMKMKERYNLGVIQGADMQIITSVLDSGKTFSGMAEDLLKNRMTKEKVLGQIKLIKENIKKETDDATRVIERFKKPNLPTTSSVVDEITKPFKAQKKEDMAEEDKNKKALGILEGMEKRQQEKLKGK
jgi:hypothetical protein